jgi:hypothetical protein
VTTTILSSSTLVFAFFIGLSYLKGKTKVNSWLLVPPVGIAMKSKEMTGELHWGEAMDLSYLRGSAVLVDTARVRRSPTGLNLYIDHKDSVKIPIPDIYDAPLPCIGLMLSRCAADYRVPNTLYI